jgi:ABC-type antimicrobial peptide transport system permease subunit
MLGLGILVLLLFTAVFADQIRPYDPDFIQVGDKFLPPSSSHWLGTDDLGRDIFSRIVDGTRISLRVALLVLFIAGVVGTVLGVVAGYFGGLVDEVVMRTADIFFAFPSFLLAMAIVAALGPGIENAILAIGVAYWPRYARLLRGQVLTVKQDLYVEAARALGAGALRMMVVHILPNARAPLLIQLAADARVGVDDRPGARLHPVVLVGRYVPWPRHHHHCGGVRVPGRRIARLARPQAARQDQLVGDVPRAAWSAFTAAIASGDCSGRGGSRCVEKWA